MEVRVYLLVNADIPVLTFSGSMLTFVIAIAYLCFRTSTAQRAITAVLSGIVSSLVIWEISVHWKSSHYKEYYIRYARYLVFGIKHWLMQLLNVDRYSSPTFIL